MKAPLLRSTHRVPAADASGLTLHMRHMRPDGPSLGSVVLVHGATIASGIWDIAVPGYSTLEALAAAGFSAWALDIRGYARSDRMSYPDKAYAAWPDAVADIDATVGYACRIDAVDKVVLVGMSWGSITSGCYATLHSARVRALALIAPIYGTPNSLWVNDLADGKAPGLLNTPFGATRAVSPEDLLQRWDAEIPHEDKSKQRDPEVFHALMRDTIEAESSPVSATYRVPNGTLHDLFEAFSGRPLYDASLLSMPVFLLRGEHDATSTRADAQLLMSRLAPNQAQLHTVADAGHFVTAERAAPEFQRLLVEFLHSQVRLESVTDRASAKTSDVLGT